MRREYKMTQRQMDELLEATLPSDPFEKPMQQRAAAAWTRLGRQLGFDWQTVVPLFKNLGVRRFTAEEAPALRIATLERICADLLREAVQTLKDIGGCDHSVGLCVCPLRRLVEDATDLLPPAAAEGAGNDQAAAV